MSNYLNIDIPNWEVFSLEFSCENTGNRWVSESEKELYFYQFKINT